MIYEFLRRVSQNAESVCDLGYVEIIMGVWGSLLRQGLCRGNPERFSGLPFLPVHEICGVCCIPIMTTSCSGRGAVEARHHEVRD